MLDAAAYPHIFECILESAPYTALLALRAASRDVRRRADAQLAAGHVVICCDKNLPQIRLPALRSWKGGALGLSCEVLDLVGCPASGLLDGAIPIPTVRLMYNTTGERDIRPWLVQGPQRWLDMVMDTYVLFVPLAYLLMGPSPRPARRPLRRVVRNVSLHPEDMFIGPNVSMDRINYIDESVWVFHHADQPISIAGRGLQNLGAAAILHCAFKCAQEEVLAGTRVVFVGLDAFPSVSWKKRTVRRPLSNLLAKALGKNLADVELRSLAEHRARLGPGRAALEMDMRA